MGKNKTRPAFHKPNPLANQANTKLQQALSLHQQGRFAEAEALYKQILQIQPQHFDALHLLGVLRYQIGQILLAVDLITKAIKINPSQPAAYSNLGLAQQKIGLLEESLYSFDRAITLKPDYAEAHNNRGNILRDLKRYDQALTSYESALGFKPDYVDAYNNHGNVLRDLGRYAESVASYDRAIALNPAYTEAIYNRANALRHLKRNQDALSSYDQALAIKPDHTEALNNRGNTLRDLKKPEDALKSYDLALKFKPDYAEALNNRGNTLIDLLRFEEALASFDRALLLRPDYAEALKNRGTLLRDLKRHEEAVRSFQQLLDIDPDYPYALGNKFYCQLHGCDWSCYASTAQTIISKVNEGKLADIPFSFLAISDSPTAQLKCAESFAADAYPASPNPLWQGERYAHNKIKVAYLSADFHNHATSYLMVELFETHDKSHFETYALSFGPDTKDDMRTRLNRAFDQFIDVRQHTDLEIAQMLRHMEIDIAIDLKGYTGESRSGILAHRAAPIQVNYLGYPGSMGASYIDYLIADQHVIPPTQQACYSEQVVYLPDTYQVNDSKRPIADKTPTRQEAGLPSSGFVFCCFNNNYKITPEVFDIWMRLLGRVEDSVLWLLEDNDLASRNLKAEAEKRGVAAERLVFAPRASLHEHLARHRLADLFLDTLPYNAHTTASDALWAGLPVLTRSGESFASRVAASLLYAIGLPELITHSAETYEALALELATSPSKLVEIKNRLRQNRDTYPLFDTNRFRQHIESAYTTMWQRYQQGMLPAGFAVNALP